MLINYLKYDETSPSGLVWSKTRGSGIINSIAGSYDKTCGYWRVGRVERLLCHRIVWSLHYGEIEDGFIVDHIDGNKTNNLISNLRKIVFENNAQNAGMYLNNTSGVTGVSFNVTTSSWGATWVENGRPKRKTFSVNKWGSAAKDLAIKHRNMAIERLNLNGQAYTERHGK